MGKSLPGPRAPAIGAVPVGTPGLQDNSYADCDDLALLVRWKGGDEDAFTEIIARHRPQLYGVLMRRLKDPVDCEDALQEVWLKLSDHSRDLNRPFGAWLHRVAVNQALDLLRRRATRAKHDATFSDKGGDDVDSDRLANEPDTEPSPEARLLAVESGREVWDCVQRLKGKRREVMHLRFWGDFKLQEIANQLGVSSPGGIKQHLARGLLEVKSCLEQKRSALQVHTGTAGKQAEQ